LLELLWTAPEHLTSSDNAKTATASSDIYSLAIILQEILLRTLPYQTGDTTVMLAKGTNNNNKWLKNFDKRPHRPLVTPCDGE